MVYVTHYTSDIHANTGHIRSSNTLLNFLAEETKAETYRCNAGDDTSQDSTNDYKQDKGLRKRLETSILSDEFGGFRGSDHRCDGNHDLEELTSTYKTVKTHKSFDVATIGGKKHVFIYNTSADFFGDEAKNRAYLSKNKEKLEKELEDAYCAVIHENPMEGFRAYQDENPNTELAEILDKSGVTIHSGHVHGSKIKNSDGRFIMRTCGKSDDQSTFFRVSDEQGESIYEVKNSVLADIASQIDPTQKYSQRETEVEFQKELNQRAQELQSSMAENQKRQTEFLQTYDPRLKDDLQKHNEEMRSLISEYENNNDVSELSKDQAREGFSRYVIEQRPELIEVEKELKARSDEFEKAYRESLEFSEKEDEEKIAA